MARSGHEARGCRAAVAVAALAAALAGPSWCAEAQQGGSVPPPAVVVAPVENRDVAPSWEFISRVQSIQAVDVVARVQGYLEDRKVDEGTNVKVGQLLFVIEPAPYQAALEAAQAQLAKAQATLRQADLNLARLSELRSRQVEPQANVDQAQAQRDSAAADVQAAQAQVDTAQINFGYTQISSPIDGRIGRANVTKGNVVGPTTGPLARIDQLDPIRVVFSVDDRTLTNVRQQNQGLSLEQLNARFVPTLRLGNGQMYPEKGKIDFVDNQVDPNTGTVAVWASFANPQGLLLPNQFATVVIHPDQKQERPVVPVAAVQQDQQGKYVFVVGDGDHVQQRRIETDFQLGQDLVVKSGLREGETVVVQGLQKVKPGAQVKPVAQQNQQQGGGGQGQQPSQPAAQQGQPKAAQG
ncbi:MAG TPA: efflux RND transporter periplasmic adaptor subunit [Gaiellales bacterium]|nr:efflux RND transporter periplasmic adaptor subunit [Gaiellales bacterium]